MKMKILREGHRFMQLGRSRFSHKKRLAGALLLGMGMMPMSPALASSSTETVAPWVYDSMVQLAGAGYLELPERPLDSYSRQELGDMIAKALTKMESARTGAVNDFGQLSRLLVMDEVELKLAKEQEQTALKNYEAARGKAAQAAEAYLRASMLGENRLEIMQPLMEKHTAAQSQLEYAARDYAEARSRTAQRTKMLDYLQNRYQEMLEAESEAAVNNMAAMPSGGMASALPPSAVPQTGSSYGVSATGASDIDRLMVPPTGSSYGVSPETMDNAGRLRAEFISELEKNSSIDNLNARQQLASNIPVKEMPKDRFQVDVEVRLDAGHYGGDDGIGNRTRLRTRVYPDYNIDGNWHARGMIEWEKVLSGPRGRKDGKVRFDRYYLSGDVGLVHTDVGAFGSLLAEGNIYDSRFKGIRLSTGKPVQYSLEYGRADQENMKRTYNLTASYKGPDYKLEGGYYRFEEKGGGRRDIYMANYRHALGVFDVGAMLLYGKDRNRSGKTGGVFTLDYRPLNSWRPYTYTGWLKYYYQPASTYVLHTMNGMADLMSAVGGFKGWGLGFNYNLPSDWSLGLELYRLKDLNRGGSSNTVWGSVTKYFESNKEE